MYLFIEEERVLGGLQDLLLVSLDLLLNKLLLHTILNRRGLFHLAHECQRCHQSFVEVPRLDHMVCETTSEDSKAELIKRLRLV